MSVNFNNENVYALKRYEQQKSTEEIGYMCPRGLFGPPVVTLTK